MTTTEPSGGGQHTATDGLDRIVRSLDAAARRFADTLEGAPDADRPVKGLEWSIGELATHVALVLEISRAYVAGRTDPALDLSDLRGGSLARSSQALLDAEPRATPRELAQRIRRGASALAASTEARTADAEVHWHGRPTTLGSLLSVALGEVLVHGDDLGRSLSLPWRIARTDATLAFGGMPTVFPAVVDPRGATGVRIRMEVRIRGGPRAVLCIDHGAGTVLPPGGPVDCRLSVDPVAYLLVGYGRRSLARAVLTGKILVWGRRPWAAAAFDRSTVQA